ncbi:transcription elongation factor GreA [Candidatus Saccharibacteria bacterium]|jgi:transcription elongation factor GreA|nr:transcription elongation factor GreA [Candidatus Saccharibacteria bacterium]
MSKQNDFYLTKEGLAELEAELKDLKENKRKEVAAALKEAKEFGDLSENTDWDDAKSRQLFIEGRISELENILKHAKVIEGVSGDIISVGSTVDVEIEDGKHTFQIVGSTEADPDQGKISDESPIGKALLGKKVGEHAEVEIPAGITTYKVVKIK